VPNANDGAKVQEKIKQKNPKMGCFWDENGMILGCLG